MGIKYGGSDGSDYAKINDFRHERNCTLVQKNR